MVDFQFQNRNLDLQHILHPGHALKETESTRSNFVHALHHQADNEEGRIQRYLVC